MIEYLVFRVIGDLHAAHRVHLLEVQKQFILSGGHDVRWHFTVCQKSKRMENKLGTVIEEMG